MIQIHKQLQMVNLHDQYLRLKDEIDAGIQQVLDSCAFINGQAVKDFERQLSAYMGGCHVIPCGNGTDALQIALMALGLQPGDEVIVPAFTYVASAEVIALLGLKPVFVDVDGDTFNISDFEQAISSKTRAVIPVHLFGLGADMEMVMRLAEKHGLYVIEDNAQSLGGEHNGQKLGTIGHIGCTSFFPSKPLGCYGDGGALFTHDDALAERIRMIANHGQMVKYHHDIVGCNSRLDSIQAAILSAKLPHLDEYNDKRRQVARRYTAALRDIVQTPTDTERSVFHQYTIQTPRRDELKAYLADRGIPSMVYYPLPLHHQPAYHTSQSLPVAERLAQEVLSLPIHTEMDEAQQDYIIETIKEFFTLAPKGPRVGTLRDKEGIPNGIQQKYATMTTQGSHPALQREHP